MPGFLSGFFNRPMGAQYPGISFPGAIGGSAASNITKLQPASVSLPTANPYSVLGARGGWTFHLGNLPTGSIGNNLTQ